MDSFEKRVKASTDSGDWWNPKEGDYIVGTLEDIRKIETRKGKNPALFLKEKGTGKIRAMWLYTIIEKKIREEKIKKGDTIGIKFIENRGKYKLFNVLVDRPHEKEKHI